MLVAEVVEREVGAGRVAQSATAQADDARSPTDDQTVLRTTTAPAAGAAMMGVPMVVMVWLLAMVVGRVHGAPFPRREAKNGPHFRTPTHKHSGCS